MKENGLGDDGYDLSVIWGNDGIVGLVNRTLYGNVDVFVIHSVRKSIDDIRVVINVVSNITDVIETHLSEIRKST